MILKNLIEKKQKMNKKTFVTSVLCIFFLLNSIFTSSVSSEINDITLPETSATSEGSILYVGGSGPGNYTKIQDAINNASNGGTVFVYNGIYNENIVIPKRLNLIGEDRNTTIINGCETEDVIKIIVDNINISEFTIKNGHIGVKINSTHNTLTNNNIYNNYNGIWIEHADNNTINNNKFSSNIYYGIIGWYAKRINIINNDIKNNGFGILAVSCYLSNISNNCISNHSLAGIDLVFSSNNLIVFNDISSNKIGVWLGESTSNLVKYNNISNNNIGVKLSCSLYNDINYNNICRNKKAGVSIYTHLSNSIYNWWGHSSGPYHPVTNRCGKGDNISCSYGYIFYRPYLKYPINITQAKQNPILSLTPLVKYNHQLENILRIILKAAEKSVTFGFSSYKMLMGFSSNHKERKENEDKLDDQLLPIKNNGQYDMVIIAPTRFVIPLQRLVIHKNGVGIKTRLIQLSEIYHSYRGRDKPEQIKYFIKDAVKKWNTKYVMLVGDINRLPIRKVWLGGKTVITDLYYADIYDREGNFSNWDTNNNGIYGEFNYNGETDEIDLIPDVGVGRLPCRNVNEVKTVVDKIIGYEKNTYGKNWFKRFILCGGDTFAGYGDISEGEFLCEKVNENMDGFTPIKLWMSNGKLSPQNITNEINKGAGFVLFVGHGGPTTWLTYSLESESKDIRYSMFSIKKDLVNGYRLPVVYIDACLTAKLDSILPCFAWSFVVNRDGGAVAAIGSVRANLPIIEKNGFIRGANLLTFLFFDAYKDSSILSNMFMKAQTRYIKIAGKDYITLEEFILLGDPSLRIGGYPPSQSN